MARPMSPDEPAADPPREFVVAADDEGCRLDVLLTRHFSDHSRVLLRRAIADGGVLLDGARPKVAYRVRAGQRVSVVLPQAPRQCPLPENIPLEILYEDQSLAVVNKPPAMVVHPARGHWSGTLASALRYHFEVLSTAGGDTRPGIVHRLDRDTSGVVLVAKSDLAHLRLSRQFADRSMQKEYLAIVVGQVDRDSDLVDEPIGAHPTSREKMAIRRDDPASRPAQTIVHVRERFRGFALVTAFPKTGRTHQIRLHLAHRGHPVLCDRLYGGRARLTEGELERRQEDDRPLLERQALHAARITFAHPESGQIMTVEAPTPADIERTLLALRKYRGL